MTEVGVAVGVGVLTAGLLWAGPRGGRAIHHGATRLLERLVAWHRRREAARERKRRAARIAAAVAANGGRPVPVDVRGLLPKIVAWSDGSETYHFCGDYAAYKEAMWNGYPPTRTLPGYPPKIVT